jgi:CO/xanthine dehydrogenase FAD-binding subunit
MRAHIPSYELTTPRSLKDALAQLKAQAGALRPFAGGTDLMVLLEAGHLEHRRFINLWSLPELRGIRFTSRSVSIGALATYADIQRSPLLSREFPLLGAAASETGAIAIQNRGTLGGNIANASPAADTPPALLVYDAELELISSAGTRRVPYSQFHTGYKKTILRPDELISRVRLKRETGGLSHYYRKVGTRKAQAISKVCLAGALGLSPQGLIAHVRIALGSIAATPFRCAQTEAALLGKPLEPSLIARARKALASEITPIDDIRSTAEYRLRVAGNLLEEFLARAAHSAQGRPRA